MHSVCQVAELMEESPVTKRRKLDSENEAETSAAHVCTPLLPKHCRQSSPRMRIRRSSRLLRKIACQSHSTCCICRFAARCLSLSASCGKTQAWRTLGL